MALHELMTGVPYAPLHDSVPEPVRTVVDRALAREPNARFRSCEELRHALEQAMIGIGHLATSDDVAGVLAHFSRERTARRRQAIDAVVKAAQEARAEPVPSARTKVAPRTAVIEPPAAGGPVGPKGTRVLEMAALGLSPEPSSPFAISGENPSHVSSIKTGPSLRTMQGAAMSTYPVPEVEPPASMNKIIAAAVILAVVALLGLIGVFVVVRNGTPPATDPASAADPAVAATVVQPTPTPVVGLADAEPAAPPPTSGIILGASDAGPIVTHAATPAAVAPTAPPAPAAKAATNPARKGSGTSKGRGAKGEPTDEYGF
jgi:serine/threonine-protein kinase